MRRFLKENVIRVLIVPVGIQPYPCLIRNELKAMRDIVRGNIEAFPLDSLEEGLNLFGGIAIINEDGKITPGIRPNRHVYHQGVLFGTFYGRFFICGSDEKGNFTSLDSRQEAHYKQLFAADALPGRRDT